MELVLPLYCSFMQSKSLSEAAKDRKGALVQLSQWSIKCCCLKLNITLGARRMRDSFPLLYGMKIRIVLDTPVKVSSFRDRIAQSRFG